MGANNRSTPVVTGAPQTIRTGPSGCPMQNLCYVNSARTTRVSKDFTKQEHISVLKRSSVAVGYRFSPPQGGQASYEIIGSGTLIGPNLVLTSAHTMEDLTAFCSNQSINYDEKNILVLFDYEYTARSVDTSNPQIVTPEFAISVACIKEEGARDREDYALLVLAKPVFDNSRIAKISKRMLISGQDIITLQHPKVQKGDPPNHTLMVARVSGGPITTVDAMYDAYANFVSRPGSSGGGVFDKECRLVGIIHGTPRTGAYGWIAKMDDIVACSKKYLKKKFPENQDTCVITEGTLCGNIDE